MLITMLTHKEIFLLITEVRIGERAETVVKPVNLAASHKVPSVAKVKERAKEILIVTAISIIIMVGKVRVIWMTRAMIKRAPGRTRAPNLVTVR